MSRMLRTFGAVKVLRCGRGGGGRDGGGGRNDSNGFYKAVDEAKLEEPEHQHSYTHTHTHTLNAKLF